MNKLVPAMRMMFVLLALLLSPQVMADGLEINDPADGWLNMRTGPGTGFAILQRLDNGMVVDELDQDGSWSYVRTPGGASGWVYRPYTRPSARVQLTDVEAFMAHCVGEAFALQNVWGEILSDLPRLEHREIAAGRRADGMVEVAANHYVHGGNLEAFRTRVGRDVSASEDAILARISTVGDLLPAMDRSEDLHEADCNLFLDPASRP